MQPQRFKEAARSVSAPSLFHLQRDDDIFPSRGQLELLDLVAANPSCSSPFVARTRKAHLMR